MIEDFLAKLKTQVGAMKNGEYRQRMEREWDLADEELQYKKPEDFDKGGVKKVVIGERAPTITLNRTRKIYNRLIDCVAGANLGNLSADESWYSPEELESANIAASKMMRLIRNQWKSAKVQDACNEAIWEMVSYGTGVLRKATSSVASKSYATQTANGVAFVERQQIIPVVSCIPVRNFYFSDAKTIDGIQSCAVVYRWSDNELRQFASRTKFVMQEAVAEILGEGVKQDSMGIVDDNGQGKYTVWEVSKFFDAEDIRQMLEHYACACVEAGMPDAAAMVGIDSGEPSPLLTVWVCQDRVLRMSLSPTRERSIPFAICPYLRNPNSIYGMGVPALMRTNAQYHSKASNATIMNAAAAAMPTRLIEKDVFAFAGTTYSPSSMLLGPQIIPVRSGLLGQTVTQDLSTINYVESNIELVRLFEAKADDDIDYQDISSGLTEQSQQGSSFTALLNAGTTGQRAVAKEIDKCMITPLIESFVSWNNLNSNDQGIIGNFNVESSITSDALAMEIERQNLLAFVQFSSQPQFAQRVRWENVQEDLADLGVGSTRYLKTRDEVMQEREQEAQAGQADNPELIKAQSDKITADANTMRVEVLRAKTQFDIEFRQKQHADEMEVRRLEAKARFAAAQAQLGSAEIAAEVDLLKLESLTEREELRQRSETLREQIRSKAQVFSTMMKLEDGR